jgi:hypothetical protein
MRQKDACRHDRVAARSPKTSDFQERKSRAARSGCSAFRAVAQLTAAGMPKADRKMVRYQSQRAPDRALRVRLRDLANERHRLGYPLASTRLQAITVKPGLFTLPSRKGEPLGIDRIYRLYSEEGLPDPSRLRPASDHHNRRTRCTR